MTKKPEPRRHHPPSGQQGGTARYLDRAFGDRGTIQVRRGDRDQVQGPVEEIDPNKVPEVSQRPAA